MPGEKPRDLLFGSINDQLIGLGFFHEGALGSGEEQLSAVDLLLEMGTRLRTDLSKDGTPPLQITVNDSDIRFHWSSPDGVMMMKMDTQMGRLFCSVWGNPLPVGCRGRFAPIDRRFPGHLLDLKRTGIKGKLHYNNEKTNCSIKSTE